MRQEGETSRPGRLISATEIASWAYCPEQWRLHHGQGKTPNKASRTVMAAGERHHAANAVADRVATGMVRAGNRLMGLMLALLILAILVAWAWSR